MSWQPDESDIAQVSKTANYMYVLLEAGISNAQADLQAAGVDSQVAITVGNLLMQYLTWANDESTVLYNGGNKKGGKSDSVYYNDQLDKGMDQDAQGTSAIMQEFTTSSQNYEMLMKNSAMTNSHSADNMEQQANMALQSSDISQQISNLASLLGAPD